MVDRHDFRSAIIHARHQIEKYERLSDKDKQYKCQLKSTKIILATLEIMAQENQCIDLVIKKVNDESDKTNKS